MKFLKPNRSTKGNQVVIMDKSTIQQLAASQKQPLIGATQQPIITDPYEAARVAEGAGANNDNLRQITWTITSADAAAQTVVLLDALGTYTQNNSWALDADVTVTNNTHNDTALKNQLQFRNYQCTRMKLDQTSSGSTQLGNVVKVYQGHVSIGDSVLKKKYYPSTNKTPNDYQDDVALFNTGFEVNGDTAIVFDVLAGVTVVITLFFD